VAGAAGKTAFLYTESNVSADHKIRVEYLSAEENYEIIDNVAVIVEESSEETSVEAPTRDNTGLIVALVIIFVAIVGAAALFIVKWRQERF
jgi:Fe-S cluster assembly scaffold protein SufB